MSKFIKLHKADRKNEILVNVDDISMVYEACLGTYICFISEPKAEIGVIESIQEINKLINE